MRSRTFSIVAGAVAWSLSGCGGDDLVAPRQGQIRVSVVTTGALEPPAYTLSLDEQPPITVGPGVTIAFTADAGEHTVELGNIPEQCAAEDGTSQTVAVTPDATVEVTFTVTCAPIPGTISAAVTTVGSLLDADGYLLLVDDRAPEPIGVNAAVTIEDLAPGLHTVALDGIAPNCLVEGENPVNVEVTEDHAAAVAFEVTCRAGVSRWTPVPSGTEADLTGVWSANGGSPLAAGERDVRRGVEGVILRLDGGSWAPEHREDDLRPRGIWGSGPDDVYLVGYGFLASAARILHYDGSSWSSVSDFDREDVAAMGLEAVWGSSASDVFAVGFEDLGPFLGSAIWHYDGGGWLRMPVNGDVQPALTDVWGSGPADVYAVGRDDAAEPSAGVVLRYDGVLWNPVLQVEGVVFNGIWSSGPADVFAVGFLVEQVNEEFFVRGVVWHYDGSSWREMELPEVGVLHEVWGTSGSDVYAVGDDGLIVRYDGTAWTPTSVGQSTLLGIWGGAPGEVLAVGLGGTILRGVP